MAHSICFLFDSPSICGCVASELHVGVVLAAGAHKCVLILVASLVLVATTPLTLRVVRWGVQEAPSWSLATIIDSRSSVDRRASVDRATVEITLPRVTTFFRVYFFDQMLLDRNLLTL